jgi:outer membrane biosynthesis protein TonB
MVGANEWLAAQRATNDRNFLNLLIGSFVAHAMFLLVLAFSPTSDAPLLPEVLRIDLVAALPPPAPKASPPSPSPAPAPAPKPVPKQVVLPKQAPRAVPKKRVPPPPTKREPVKYEDALSQLRNELGEKTPPVVAPSETAPSAESAEPAVAQSTGVTVDKDVAAWVIATKRHVRSRYITPPEFLNQSLATGVKVVLTSGGELVGTPEVVRPSGDPYFDENAVRAVMTSAPLPAPPRSGAYTFRFKSEE